MSRRLGSLFPGASRSQRRPTIVGAQLRGPNTAPRARSPGAHSDSCPRAAASVALRLLYRGAWRDEGGRTATHQPGSEHQCPSHSNPTPPTATARAGRRDVGTRPVGSQS